MFIHYFFLLKELQATKKPVKQETEREKKERIAREGKKYWEKFSQILPDETFRVWKVRKMKNFIIILIFIVRCLMVLLQIIINFCWIDKS
jgi:hypothetical protein